MASPVCNVLHCRVSALAAQFEREQQAGQKQFLHRMPLVAAEDALANNHQINQAKASPARADGSDLKPFCLVCVASACFVADFRMHVS